VKGWKLLRSMIGYEGSAIAPMIVEDTVFMRMRINPEVAHSNGVSWASSRVVFR